MKPMTTPLDQELFACPICGMRQTDPKMRFCGKHGNALAAMTEEWRQDLQRKIIVNLEKELGDALDDYCGDKDEIAGLVIQYLIGFDVPEAAALNNRCENILSNKIQSQADNTPKHEDQPPAYAVVDGTGMVQPQTPRQLLRQGENANSTISPERFATLYAEVQTLSKQHILSNDDVGRLHGIIWVLTRLAPHSNYDDLKNQAVKMIADAKKNGAAYTVSPTGCDPRKKRGL